MGRDLTLGAEEPDNKNTLQKKIRMSLQINPGRLPLDSGLERAADKGGQLTKSTRQLSELPPLGEGEPKLNEECWTRDYSYLQANKRLSQRRLSLSRPTNPFPHSKAFRNMNQL